MFVGKESGSNSKLGVRIIDKATTKYNISVLKNTLNSIKNK